MIVYIRLPLSELQNRLGDLDERGISMDAGQTLEDIYEERAPLYEKYADFTVDPEGLPIWDTAMMIRNALKRSVNTSTPDLVEGGIEQNEGHCI